MNRWKIGDINITRVVEIEVTGGMSRFLPDATREAVRETPWLMPHFANEEGRLRSSIHALIIETADRCIVVDTCVGNDKQRAMPFWHQLQTTFLDDLAAAGYARERIDTVMCTHLHIDHVGWNTMLIDGIWCPTFPNARYLMGETEFNFWRTNGEDEQRQVMADSVEPVFDAGLVDLVSSTHMICPEVQLLPTPGHTPGHVSVLIESKGEQALITGDFLHHPCQFAHPEWCAVVDEDSARAQRTRREMFARFADTPTLIIGTHFATPTAGHLLRDGNVFRLAV